MGNGSSYRDSHLDANYGARYRRTYEQGYYFEQWKQLERPILELLFEKLARNGFKSCLDFACGTGRILSVAENYFPETMGVDISEPMLMYARETCKNSIILNQDITRDEIDRKFDIVTAFRFFLNAESQLRAEALGAFWKILAPNGLLITNCHVNKTSILGLFYRLRNRVTSSDKANVMSFKEFEKILEEHRFHIVQSFWYSYLPRTGWYLGWIPSRFMTTVENLCKKLPFVSNTWAQSFMLVCQKVGH